MGSQRRHRAARRRWTAIRAYGTPRFEQIFQHFMRRPESGTTLHAGGRKRHAAVQLPFWSAGDDLGRRTITTSRSRWPAPTSAVGPTSRETGMPVWATRMRRASAGRRSTLGVVLQSSSSSGSAIILIAGALQTRRPGGEGSNAHSSAWRADASPRSGSRSVAPRCLQIYDVSRPVRFQSRYQAIAAGLLHCRYPPFVASGGARRRPSLRVRWSPAVSRRRSLGPDGNRPGQHRVPGRHPEGPNAEVAVLVR